MTRYITKLALSQDDYLNLLEALQLFIKSPKVTVENFDELRNLYGHIKEQYNRRSQEEVDKGSKIDVEPPAPPSKKKVGTKKVEVIEVENEVEDKVEAHPFIASAKKNWICASCGKSRNSSYHKTPEGKLWMGKRQK